MNIFIFILFIFLNSFIYADNNIIESEQEKPNFELPEIVISGEYTPKPFNINKKIFTQDINKELPIEFSIKDYEIESLEMEKQMPLLNDLLFRHNFFINKTSYGSFNTFSTYSMYGQERKTYNGIIDLDFEKSSGYMTQDECKNLFKNRGFEKIQTEISFFSKSNVTFCLNLMGFSKKLKEPSIIDSKIKKIQAKINGFVYFGKEKNFCLSFTNIKSNFDKLNYSTENTNFNFGLNCNFTQKDILYKIETNFLIDSTEKEKEIYNKNFSNAFLKIIFPPIAEKMGLNLGLKFFITKKSILFPYIRISYVLFKNTLLELEKDGIVNVPFFNNLYFKNDYVEPNFRINSENNNWLKFQIKQEIKNNIIAISGLQLSHINNFIIWEDVNKNFLFEPYNKDYIIKTQLYFKLKIIIKENLDQSLEYIYEKANSILPFSPKHKLEAKLNYDGSKINWNIESKYVGEQKNSSTTLPFYFVINNKIQKKIFSKLSIFLNGENLLNNKNFIDEFGFSKKGINFKIGAEYKF
ncbi:MAG: hypothetical protein ABIB46_05775 [bacterium]